MTNEGSFKGKSRTGGVPMPGGGMRRGVIGRMRSIVGTAFAAFAFAAARKMENYCRGESKSGLVWRAKAEWLLGQG